MADLVVTQLASLQMDEGPNKIPTGPAKDVRISDRE
jgi:hypothetical protein